MAEKPEKKEAQSIKDIARAANVSHSTVSRALRNSPLVSAETADRIRRIAAESNFRVSAIGRSLATGRTYLIGVVVSSIADPFVAEVVSGIEEMVNARGYSVILASSKGDPDQEIKVVQTFEERRVDGLLLTSSRVGAMYSALLADTNIPIVVVNNPQVGDSTYSVLVDHAAASRSAVRFLVQLGHRRVAYVGDRFGFQSNSARHDGYRQCLEEFGMGYRPEYVVTGASGPEGGMLAMDQLVALPERPTAVFCYNDMTAVGVLASARRHQLRVPEDLSVVGFDDLLIASYTHPPLTTVRQPTRLIGRVAAEMLLNLLSGSKIEANRRMQCELIVRESTAPPPARSAAFDVRNT
jgi:DNA-binding LacI/PurR family transcriptional regulator